MSNSFVPLFCLGRVLATRTAIDSLANDEILDCLLRHHTGDWGVLDEADKAANEAALKFGNRIFSAYEATGGIKFWIITEADRSYTTVLLPGDYWSEPLHIFGGVPLLISLDQTPQTLIPKK